MNTSGRTVVTRSPGETRKLGEKTAEALKPGDIVFLSGELGSGKTTFVQGVARGLGIAKNVRSSSFIVVNEYASSNGKNKLYHMDLYRLTPSDLDSFGLDEYLSGKAVCVVEWAEKLGRRVKADMKIHFKWVSDNERGIKVEK
jgi:tRNA threonylcarbamoyladenosine biosynthesis protein TsaE